MSRVRHYFCTIAIFIALVHPAPAAIKNWASVVGGNTGLPSNWSPIGIPAAGDDHIFGLSSTYTVTYSGLTPNSNRHIYKLGSVSLNFDVDHTATNGLTIGELAGDNATTTLTTGDLTATGPVIVGANIGSIGVLRVNDSDARLDLTTSAGDLTVGSNGAGTLNLTGGGILTVSDRFTAGSNSSSTANVTVSDVVSDFPLRRSVLSVSGLSPASAIGAGGDVTMNVLDGGLATFAGDLNVAQGFASTSTLTIEGLGGTLLFTRARVDVEDDLSIGGNQAAGAPGGAGTVRVRSGGTLAVGGIAQVGADPDGGTGTLHLDTGGQIDVGSLNVGAGGTLDFVGGLLDVEGGTFTHQTSSHLILGGVRDPVFTLRNGATGVLNTVSGGRVLTVGGGQALVAESAHLDIRSGSTLTVSPGTVIFAESADDQGGMVVSGAGSAFVMNTNSLLSVPQSGDGQLEVELGAQVTGGLATIAANAGSTGTLSVGNPGTTASFNQVFAGGSTTVPGGDGTLSVTDGAVCNVTNTVRSVRVWHTGQLDIDAATLDCGGEILVEGAAILHNATIHAPLFRVINTAIEASGLIDARTHIDSASATLTLNGDLTAGTNAFTDGFSNFGLVQVGDHKLTARSAVPARLDDCIVGPAGEIAAPNGVSIGRGAILSGDGVISCDVVNAGQIVGTGTGFTFKGTVFGVGEGISGPACTFIVGGGFEGAGTIQSIVITDSIGFVTATGGLTLGQAASSSGVNIAGRLNAGPHVVTLRDFDLAALSGLVTMSGGTLVADNGIALDGNLTGSGVIDARTIMDPTTVVTLTGDLAIGRDVPSGANINGSSIHIGSHTLTVVTPGTVNLPSLLTVEGGTLDALSLTTGLADRIEGFGTIDAPLGLSGTLSPEGPSPDPTDTLVITGQLSMANSATLEFDISGRAAGAFDTIEVRSNAVLAGELDIHVLDRYVPADGERFELMTFPSRSGSFLGMQLSGAPNRCAEIAISSNAVNLIFHTLVGNLDGDNVVGLGDLSIVLANFGLTSATPADGDLDDDGDVDLGDLSIMLSVFGTSCS